MANTFLLKIITPDREVYSGEIEKISLKSADGGFEVYANHASMIASTIPCIARFKDAQGVDNELFISKALAQVSNNQMIICSDAAEFEEDIDVARAEDAKVRAEDRLREAGLYNKERAEAALLRAKQRLILTNSKK